MTASRVLFKLGPDREIEHTAIGPAIQPRAPARPRLSWARFPFGAAAAEGIPYVRDFAAPEAPADLRIVHDDELVEAIDRHQARVEAADRALLRDLDADTEVVDVEDL